MQAQSFRPLLPSSLRSFPGGEFAKPGTCSTQAGQAPKLRAFGGKEYTPSPVFSTCHSEASSPLDRKRQRPRSRGPAGPGGGWSSESTKAAAAVKLPAGADYNSQMALRQPTRLPPQSPIPPPATPSALAFAWASASERGRPVWTNRSPQSRDVRAGVCCLSEALKASKWREAISCSRYHP